MEINYGWKVGSCIHIDAKKAWKEWEALGEEKTKEGIVELAAKQRKLKGDYATNKYFEENNLWDDKHNEN